MEPQSRAYTYTLLYKLFNPGLTNLGSKVNVYGVIRGSIITDVNNSFHCAFEIIDDSLASSVGPRTVQVSIFTQQGDLIPDGTVFRSGRVIRLHRAVVESQDKSFVRLEGRVPTKEPGKKRHGFLSWVIFDETTGSFVASSSDKRTHSKEDEERVQQLIKWNTLFAPPSFPDGPAAAVDGEANTMLSEMEDEHTLPKADSSGSKPRGQTIVTTSLPPGWSSPPAAAAAAAAVGTPTVANLGLSFHSNLVRLADVRPTSTPFSCVVYVC